MTDHPTHHSVPRTTFLRRNPVLTFFMLCYLLACVVLIANWTEFLPTWAIGACTGVLVFAMAGALCSWSRWVGLLAAIGFFAASFFLDGVVQVGLWCASAGCLASFLGNSLHTRKANHG